MIKNRIKTKVFVAILLCVTTILGACSSEKANNGRTLSVEELDRTYPKLFLLSKGLTTDTLKLAFLNFLENKPITYSVAVIVNASSSDKKKKKKTKKIKIQFSEIGFDSTKIEQFDLMQRNPQELSKFDIIYILGGNPFRLLDEVNKSDSRKILKELTYQDKILMGYSAGSLLLGPDLTLMNHTDSLLEFNEIALKELSCLHLYNFHIFPHYTNFTKQVPELIKQINQFERQSELPIYRLNDNQGIIYQDGEIELIGQ
jgi:dipeptidase E